MSLQPIYKRAYDYYKNALKAGEDGRPDFKARKSCNYMTEAVEVSIKYYKNNI